MVHTTSGSMQRVGTLLLALLAGAVGGALFAGASVPATGPAAFDTFELLGELRELRRELAAGLAVRPQGAVERQAAAAADDRADPRQLAATVADLARAVEALTLRAEVLGSQRAGGAGVLEQLAGRASRDVAALVAVARSLRNDEVAVQGQWMFVPATEILRRFGRPTRIKAGKGDGMIWAYEFEAEDASFWVGFTIVDGVVVRVD
jgi:hypothetical protein